MIAARCLRTGVVVAGVLASACASTRVSTEVPAVELPGTYLGDAAAPAAASLAASPWKDVFRDAPLQALVTQALDGNVDVQLAAVRVLEARAAVGISRAAAGPDVTASLSGGGQRTPALGNNDARTAGAIGLQGAASWDLDFWGRLGSATAAARARLVAADWARRAVVTAVVTDVAVRYFTLGALDEELDIARRTLASRQASLDLARVRERGGVTTLLDVRQAEQLVYDAAGRIADLERRVSIEEHALGILLGRPGAPVVRARVAGGQPPLAEIPSGLPSDLLERRPDVKQAEQLVLAANAELASARAAFFPRIALTGSAGLASTALTSLFTGGAGLWSAAASAVQPVFNRGRLTSQRELAEARRQEATLIYVATVREAFREVADALVSHGRVRAFREQQELLRAAAADARRLADLRYQGGATSYLEVLDADTRLFSAELGLVEARRQELASIVESYRALGGGWQ